MSMRIGIVIAIISFLMLPNPVFAADFSSSSFKVQNPVLQTGGQKSTSTSFQLLGSIGQISIGTSSATSLKISSGFLYFPPEAITSTTFNFTTGGSMTLTNIDSTSVVFSVPSNFYSENLHLQASSYANNFFTTNKPAPSGQNFIGKTYDFDFNTTSGSSVSAVSQSITMVVSYTDEDISGFNESALAPYRWGASDSSWQLISGATIDTGNNKITFSTMNFSSFALFSSSSSSQQQQSSGGGGGNASLIEFFEALKKRLAPEIPISCPSSQILGDLDCDKKVGLKDLSIFLYFMSQTGPNPADINNDKTVNAIDLSFLFFAWTEKFLTFEGNGLASILPAPKKSTFAGVPGGLAAVIVKPETTGTEQKVEPAPPQVLTGFFAKAAALVKKATDAVYNLFTRFLK